MGPLISNLEGGKLRRTIDHCRGNLCECISDAIQELLNANAPHGVGAKGLKQHFAEQLAPGAKGPGTDVWNTHQTNIDDQQKNLRDHLREHNERGCGGGPSGGSPVPSDAWNWATRPLPTRQDWGASNPVAYEGLTGSAKGDAAAAVGTIGAGYVIYRVVRMIPSLVAWPTIPANLAFP